jgi:hypothetical protein
MVFAIITAWLAYKRAKQTGRNPITWAIIGAVVYIGTQLIASLGLGFTLGVAILIFHLSDSLGDTLSIPLTVIAIAASFFASWLLLKYLDKTSVQEQVDPLSILNK